MFNLIEKWALPPGKYQQVLVVEIKQIGQFMIYFQSYCFLLFSQLAIGAAAIFARYALQSTGPVNLSALRLSIAAIPLLANFLWLKLRTQPIRENKKFCLKSEALLAVGGIVLGGHFVAWIASLNYISVAISTLLVCMTPIWNAIYEKFILDRQTRKVFWFALLLAIAGLVLVAGDQPIGSLSFPQKKEGFLFGIGLALSGSVLMSCYLVIVKYIGGGESKESAYSTLEIITRTYSWAALSLVAGVCFSDEPFPLLTDTSAWGGILGMAIVSQLIGHTLLNLSIRRFSSSIVAFASLLEPLLAGILAFLFFSEKLSTGALVGGFILFFALVLALYADYKQPEN